MELAIVESITQKPVWSDDERYIEGWDETGSEILVLDEDGLCDLEVGDAESEGTRTHRVIATIRSEDIEDIMAALAAFKRTETFKRLVAEDEA